MQILRPERTGTQDDSAAVESFSEACYGGVMATSFSTPLFSS